MERVAVSEFRANLMSFLKRVEAGEIITITSRGLEIAKIVPPENKREQAKEALKKLSKTATIGDVISPVEAEWKILK